MEELRYLFDCIDCHLLHFLSQMDNLLERSMYLMRVKFLFKDLPEVWNFGWSLLTWVILNDRFVLRLIFNSVKFVKAPCVNLFWVVFSIILKSIRALLTKTLRCNHWFFSEPTQLKRDLVLPQTSHKKFHILLDESCLNLYLFVATQGSFTSINQKESFRESSWTIKS